jgi:hypothetical protein
LIKEYLVFANFSATLTFKFYNAPSKTKLLESSGFTYPLKYLAPLIATCGYIGSKISKRILIKEIDLFPKSLFIPSLL